ncbi:MAG: hypothetical protein HQL20_04585 [Candidatus Omnitrophica bacterium]|nr:hypothetical protein [Candidatus Omnitrophota bacterium]
MKMANDIPFDDRVNHNASIDDLNVQLVRQYLYAVKSALLDEMSRITSKELFRRMNIVGGPDEGMKPKNIGLMLFSDDPQKFFPRTTIDVVKYKDDVGDDFDEKIFTGPAHEQVRAALVYIKNLVIVEYVHKVDGRAEADRFFNYPYAAIEESLVNAVYHRSYEKREPIEVRIYPDKIYVISYPGPMPPLGKDNINEPNVTPHCYRNSRLGDSLKELELTEGRCTGFPKIRRALKNNGSPAPVFETDDDREYFMVTLKINPRAQEMAAKIAPSRGRLSEGLSEVLSEGLKSLLRIIQENPGIKAKNLSPHLKDRPIKTIERQIKILVDKELIERRGSRKTGGYFIK